MVCAARWNSYICLARTADTCAVCVKELSNARADAKAEVQRLAEAAAADKRAAAGNSALLKEASEQQQRNAEEHWGQERQQLKTSADTAWAQLTAAQAEATELREQLQRAGAQGGADAAEVARLQVELANARKAWRVEKGVLQSQRDGFSSQVDQLRDKIGELSQELADMKEAAKAGVAVAAMRWKAGARIQGGSAAPATPPPAQGSPTAPAMSATPAAQIASRTSPLRAHTSALSDSLSPRASMSGPQLTPEASGLSMGLRPRSSTLSTRPQPHADAVGAARRQSESIIGGAMKPRPSAVLKPQLSTLGVRPQPARSAGGSNTSSVTGKSGGQGYAAALSDAKSKISSWASGASGRAAAAQGQARSRAGSMVSEASKSPA